MTEAYEEERRRPEERSFADPGLEVRSIPDLISALTTDVADLVRKEAELARTEVRENIHAATRAGARIGVGAALLIGAFLVLLQALVLLVAFAVGAFWASLIVGLAVGGAGAYLIKQATDSLKPAALAPDRAARQLKKDAHMVKEQVS